MIKERKKATDFFNEGSFPFSEKVSFVEAFPMIEDIDIKAIETTGNGSVDFEDENYRPNEWRSAHKMGIGEYIDCHNPLCFRGGFSIAQIIRVMVSEKIDYQEGILICNGYEGSPKGKRKYRSCMHNLFYKIRLKYKSIS